MALLQIIGISDICLAGLLLWPKSSWIRWVLVPVAAWGAVTAFSRITYGGWGNGYELLTRSSHVLVPVALLFALRREREPAV